MIELLPCPFCGGNHVGVMQSYDEPPYLPTVECLCGANVGLCSTEEKAIETWNQRAAPPAMATPINHIELVNLGFLDAGIDGLYYLPVSEARIQVMLYADGRTEVEIAESGNCDTVSMPGATRTGHLLNLIEMLDEANS